MSTPLPAALARDHRDRSWAQLRRSGRSAAWIASRHKVSVRAVHRGLARVAREDADRFGRGESERAAAIAPRRPWWLELVPLFPIGAFTPTSPCPHHGPIQPGSLFCCMVCSASGLDDHPALRRDPAVDPRHEPRSSAS